VQPYEVICAPYTVLATTVALAQSVGFPPINMSNPAPQTGTVLTGSFTVWSQVGTSGNKNYSDTGVTVTHTQTVSTFIPAGSTTVRKAWRTDEGLTIAFEVADLSPVTYALLMDNIALTTTPATSGAGGDNHFELMRGVQVSQYALCIRGISPVQEAYGAQYEVPSAFMMGNPAPRYSKQGPALLAIEFHAFELTPGHLATWRAATTP